MRRLKVNDTREPQVEDYANEVMVCKTCGKVAHAIPQLWKFHDKGFGIKPTAHCLTCFREYEKQKQRESRARRGIGKKNAAKLLETDNG